MKTTTTKKSFTHLVLIIAIAMLMGCTQRQSAGQLSATQAGSKDSRVSNDKMPKMNGSTTANSFPFQFSDLGEPPTGGVVPNPVLPDPIVDPVVSIPPVVTSAPQVPNIQILNADLAPADGMMMTTTQVGNEQILPLILLNNGDGPAIFSSLYFTSVTFSISEYSECRTGTLLQPTQSCRLLVRYRPLSPTGLGGETGQLSVWTQARQHVATLKGRAYPRVAAMGLYRMLNAPGFHLYSNLPLNDQLASAYTDELNTGVEVSVPFYYHPQIVEGATKVYFLKNTTGGQNYITLNASPLAGWAPVAGEPQAYLYASPPPSDLVPTAAVYELYNVSTGDHYYTQNQFEKEVRVSEGWRYEYHTGIPEGAFAFAPLNQTRITRFTVSQGANGAIVEWLANPGSECTLVGWNSENGRVTTSETLFDSYAHTGRFEQATGSKRFMLRCLTAFDTTDRNNNHAIRYDAHSVVVTTP